MVLLAIAVFSPHFIMIGSLVRAVAMTAAELVAVEMSATQSAFSTVGFDNEA